jgi:hypothetical protein
MSDYEAIMSLMARYTDAINRRQFDVVKACFTPDGVWDVNAGASGHYLFEGSDKISHGIRGLVGSSDFLAQIGSLPVIEIDGERARARSTLFEVGEKAGRRFENFGLYDDELRKVNGKWLFKSRRWVMSNSKFTQLQAQPA